MKTKIAGLLAMSWVCCGAAGVLAQNSPTIQTNETIEESQSASPPPRRAQVLGGLSREQNRINRLFEQGKITASQRDQLIFETKTLLDEEVNGAAATGGFLTMEQQRMLNQKRTAMDEKLRSYVDNPPAAPKKTAPKRSGNAPALTPPPDVAPTAPPPGQSTPRQTTPGQTSPGQTSPAQTTPEQTTTGEITTEQTAPERAPAPAPRKTPSGRTPGRPPAPTPSPTPAPAPAPAPAQ